MVAEVGGCLLRYLLFVVPAAVVVVVVRLLLPVPKEVSRKALHAIAFCSCPLMVRYAPRWQVAVVAMVAFALVVYPVLALAERHPRYAELFVQRRPGEVKSSLMQLFLGDAGIVALCWGAFGRPAVAVCAILMWGTGDAAAALVGKRWGRHGVRLPFADGRKTWEGSLAMSCVSFAVGVACKWALGMQTGLVAVALAAVVGAYVELVTHGGNDTLTVPYANTLVLLLVG